MTGARLSQLIGSAPSRFSRARNELVEDGWLDLDHFEGQIPFHRLGERATGRTVVIALPQRQTG
ncbi:hypothetical protein [Streptomyces sp. NPDC058486]|uniref:hypothetical protein n=1 Tax=unclassified Streptomyces TaxID=2593676 RepID=UPI0036672574